MKFWVNHSTTVTFGGKNHYGATKEILEILEKLRQYDHNVKYSLFEDSWTSATFYWKTQEEL